jgi:ribose 5-phosphate isomerase A
VVWCVFGSRDANLDTPYAIHPPCLVEKANMTTDATDPSAAAARAVEMVSADSVVGLGTGRAATAFVRLLAARVRAGLNVRGVPTSGATADLARHLGIPLTTLDDIGHIDVTVDGADEVDPAGNLIKGYGGALVREKIVAASSRRLVILVTPEKLVPVLGSRGRLPVEVVPFGLAPCRRRLDELGLTARPRTSDGRLFATDNGNHILDCEIAALPDPAAVEQALLAIPGVVGTGLFLGLAHTILIQNGDAVELRRGPAA